MRRRGGETESSVSSANTHDDYPGHMLSPNLIRGGASPARFWISLGLAFLASCSRAKEERALPVGVPAELAETFDADVEVEGSWVWDWLPGYDATYMSVKAADEKTFEVEFVRSTDVGSFQLATRATRTAAGLRVDRKGSDQFPAVLYPARIDGEECLVPDQAIGGGADEGHAFRRTEDGAVERMRGVWEAIDEDHRGRR